MENVCNKLEIIYQRKCCPVFEGDGGKTAGTGMFGKKIVKTKTTSSHRKTKLEC